MSIQVACPNGHNLRVKDRFAGKGGYCPHCRAKVHVPLPEEFREDDIMSVLGPPPPMPMNESESESDDEVYVHQEPQHARPAEESGIGLAGSSILRRGKVCPSCHVSTSFASSVCTRCGTPLITIFYEGSSSTRGA